MPKCIILIGPPLSGKTTYTERQLIKYPDLVILSCDRIRMQLSGGKKYIFSPDREKEVWQRFYDALKELSEQGMDISVDNTNCKLSYILKIKEIVGNDYEYEYVLFPTQLWKLYLRNIKRRITQNKWIPFKVIKQMKHNFETLNINRGYGK